MTLLRDVLIGLLTALAIGAVLLWADVGRAQDDATVLVLAQAMVAEASWHEPDHRAVAHALHKRASVRGITLQQHALEYVAAFKVNTPRTRWVRSLRLDARKPDGWPLTVSWSAHVDRWLAVLDLARRFIADPASVPNPCPGASDWGGTMDVIRGRMVPVRCVEITRNTMVRVRR